MADAGTSVQWWRKEGKATAREAVSVQEKTMKAVGVHMLKRGLELKAKQISGSVLLIRKLEGAPESLS